MVTFQTAKGREKRLGPDFWSLGSGSRVGSAVFRTERVGTFLNCPTRDPSGAVVVTVPDPLPLTVSSEEFNEVFPGEKGSVSLFMTARETDISGPHACSKGTDLRILSTFVSFFTHARKPTRKTELRSIGHPSFNVVITDRLNKETNWKNLLTNGTVVYQ